MKKLNLVNASDVQEAPFILVFGDANTGKTVFSLTADDRILVLDVERKSAEYSRHKVQESVDQKTDFDVVTYGGSTEETLSNMAELDKQGVLDGKRYRTLVIDSGSRIWDEVQLDYERQNKVRNGEVFAQNTQIQEWRKIKGPYQRIMSRIRSCPMVRIVTAHSTDVMSKDTKGNMVTTGRKRAKIEKSIEYDANIILETFIDDNGVYCALVHRDNTGIKKAGDIIPNPSYQIWSSFYKNGGGNPREQNSVPTNAIMGKQTLEQKIEQCFADPEIIEMLGVLGISDEQARISFERYNGDATVAKQRLRSLVDGKKK